MAQRTKEPVAIVSPALVGQHVHLIGTGGAGVSALARVLAGHGMRVRGSDARRSATTRALKRLGIEVCIGARAEHLHEDAVLCVHSVAVAPEHPELQEARRRGVPVLTYAEALGLLMESRYGVAIAGTHGKTTTSAMLAAALVEAGLDPTVVLGGDAPHAPGGARTGRSRLFVVEACEYRRSFHALWPRMAIVTNIEADHLDYYRDLEEIATAFRTFCAHVPADGDLIVCAEDRLALAATRGLAARRTTYAIAAEADLRAVRLTLEAGFPAFEVVARTRKGAAVRQLGRFRLAVPGRHNVLNALAAIAAARRLGADLEAIRGALARFRGVGRRFERLFDDAALSIVDDYAHHPTEVAATLAAARAHFGDRRLRVVFQPHQHSRTHHMLESFAAALAAADEVVVAPIFSARDTEAERRAVSAHDLVARLRARGLTASAGGAHGEIARALIPTLRPGDVVLTMGAGDIREVALRLAERLRNGGPRRVALPPGAARSPRPRGPLDRKTRS